MPTSLLRAGPLAADFVSGTTRPTFAVRNGHRVAVFPDAVTTETFYTFNMPTVYASGDVEVILTWMAGVAVGGDCVWEIAFEKHEPGVDDLDADSFAAGISLADTTDAVSGVPTKTVITVTSAQMDSVVQGDQFRLAVRRIGADGADTMVGTAQLMTVVIEQDAAPAGGGGGGFWTDGAGTRAGIGKGSPAPTAAGLEGLAHGTSASAAGPNSLALMANALTLGDNSIAIGQGSRAGIASTENFGVAIGDSAYSRSNKTTAIGADSRALGNYSVAIGRGAIARDQSCIAIGNTALADTTSVGHATAIGVDSVCAGMHGIAIGHLASVSPAGHYRSIVIGYQAATYVGTFVRNAIAIGYRAKVQGNNAICIGDTQRAGADSVVIGGAEYGTNRAVGSGFYNLVLKTGQTDFQGDGRYGTIGSNIFIHAGGSQSGPRLGNTATNSAFNNIVIGRQSYLYANTYDNVVIGNGHEIGDNNTQSYINKSVCIGYSNSISQYVNTAYPNYHQIAIGTYNYCANYSYGQVAIGYRCYGYGYSNGGSWGSVAIGRTCVAQGHYGNIAIGYRAYVYQGVTSIDVHGSAALGAYCYVRPITGNAAIKGALAQGFNARARQSGQRAFGSGHDSANINTKQGSFFVENLETADAVTTTLIDIDTQADKTYVVWGWLVARNTITDSENAGWSLPTQLVTRNAAGAPVLIGDPVGWTQDQVEGAAPLVWTATLTISGNLIRVQVAGDAADIVNWVMWLHVIEVRG